MGKIRPAPMPFNNTPYKEIIERLQVNMSELEFERIP